MSWTPIPHPYDKYISEDPNAYTAVDPELIRAALAGSGVYPTDNIFSSWQTMQGGGTGGGTTTNADGSTSSAPVDYKALIESDPAYQQGMADLSAAGISDAASTGRVLKQTLINWGLIPDFAGAGDKLGLSDTALGLLSQNIDPTTRELAQKNEDAGLSLHSRLARANDDNIRGIRNALAARGMYQSGELGYGLADNARQYTQAATDAEKQALGQIEDATGRYVAGERDRSHQKTDLMNSAADRALQRKGPDGTTPTNTTKNPDGTTSVTPAHFTLPANTRTVWDVNTASTMDAINAAKQSGGGVVIRPDDPESVTKANAAAEAGVPVSIQVNGSADDSPQTLAERVASYQRQYPGASFTLDLESPNFRGGPGTPGYAAMQQYAAQVQQVAGNTPITITTEGVSDFNYSAWAQNPNVIFAPQAYWGDMSGRNVQQIVNLLTSQGIPADRIIPVVAPGQDLGGYTGPVSVYGAPAGSVAPVPTNQQATPQDPYPNYSSAYVSPVPKPVMDTGTYYTGDKSYRIA